MGNSQITRTRGQQYSESGPVRRTPIADAPAATPPNADSSERLVEMFLSRYSKLTARMYGEDLRRFARHLGAASEAEAVAHLLSMGQGRANAAVYWWMTTLQRSGKSPATMNRRLACIKSCVKLARLIGLVTWSLDVPGRKKQSYRDTAGPGVRRIRQIFADLQDKIGAGDRKAARDAAILRLLFHRGLRCHEVVGLDLEHYDEKGRRVKILGKQRTQREWIGLPPKAAAAVAAWLEVRGRHDGPLFVSMRRGGRKKNQGQYGIVKTYKRLMREDVYRLLKPYGVKPHGFRHTAITAALDATGGDVRAVQRFSRHKSLNTLLVYDDARRDIAGKVAAKLDRLV